MLEAHGITCSMSRTGNCHDNAVMEAFFSTLKTELADRFESCGEAKMQLFDYIEVFYNQRRRHSTIGYVSPAQFERAAATSDDRLILEPAGGTPMSAPSDVRPSWAFCEVELQGMVRTHHPPSRGGACRHPCLCSLHDANADNRLHYISSTVDD